MLDYPNKLYFPELSTLGVDGMVPMKHKNSPECRHVSGYVLDWSKQEKQIKKDHEEWRERYHKGKNIPFVGQLPKKWNAWARSLKFAIPSGYYQEIHHWIRHGYLNWNRGNRASADTVVRKWCSQPAIKMFETAFLLLCDCIYLEATKWYSRLEKDRLAVHVLLYKFWAYQTRGMLYNRARLGELKNKIKNRRDNCGENDFSKHGEKLLADLEEHQKAIEDSYSKIRLDKELVDAINKGEIE